MYPGQRRAVKLACRFAVVKLAGMRSSKLFFRSMVAGQCLFRVLVPLPISLAGYGGLADAQTVAGPLGDSSAPTVGATRGISIPADRPVIGASGGNDVQRHRDFTGKPCLAVGGYARPHAIVPNLFDHVIIAVNTCPQRIAMRVCYYQSQDCIPMEIPGGERKEAILGTLPAMKDFRFEFREKF
jgi:hypothetical protein